MHYGITRENHDVLIRPGYYTEDFKSYWQGQTPCERDGCSSVSVETWSKNKLTDARWKRFRKKRNPFIDNDTPSYTCHAVLVGVIGWVVTRKVRHIEDHHVVESTERKTYKTQPKHIVKGGTLYAECRYVCSYDARDYDPLEHC
jgi:hypothetical protein